MQFLKYLPPRGSDLYWKSQLLIEVLKASAAWLTLQWVCLFFSPVKGTSQEVTVLKSQVSSAKSSSLVYSSDTQVPKSDPSFQQHADTTQTTFRPFTQQQHTHPPLKDRKWASEPQAAALKHEEEKQQAPNASHVHAAPAPPGEPAAQRWGRVGSGRYFMAGARRASCGGHTPSAGRVAGQQDPASLEPQPHPETRGKAVLLSGPQAEAFLLALLFLSFFSFFLPWCWGQTCASLITGE